MVVFDDKSCLQLFPAVAAAQKSYLNRVQPVSARDLPCVCSFLPLGFFKSLFLVYIDVTFRR
jgi:hypothetical protein